jgi:hypothetical protein
VIPSIVAILLAWARVSAAVNAIPIQASNIPNLNLTIPPLDLVAMLKPSGIGKGLPAQESGPTDYPGA